MTLPLFPIDPRVSRVVDAIPDLLRLISPLLLSAMLVGVASAEPTAGNTKERFRWQADANSLALVCDQGPVWRLVFDPNQPKSYFHPLSTVDGQVLTDSQPADHPWHRGLWFSWKKINHKVYWEEDPATGRAEGVTELVTTKAEPHPDFSADIVMKLNYHEQEGPALLREERRLHVSTPNAGSYAIDWRSDFTVRDQPIVLGRTPLPRQPHGFAYGGYAGFGLRFTKGNRWTFRTEGGKTGEKAIHGRDASWVDFSGPLAGSGNAGVAVFWHPASHSPGTPDKAQPKVPWYASQGISYFAPSVLFRNDATLAPGTTFTLCCRVMVHGEITNEALETAAAAYAKEPLPPVPARP